MRQLRRRPAPEIVVDGLRNRLLARDFADAAARLVASAVREGYLAAVRQWQSELEAQCRNRAVDRVELVTDEPLDQALLDYLVRRAKSF